MPQRALSTVLVVAGFMLALVLVVMGADLVQAAQRGPRWKRRLLGAGLVLLAALGLAPTTAARGAAAPTATAPAQPAAARETLADNTLWKRIMAAWQEAEAVASGNRGEYPFDEKGKKAILDKLESSGADLKALREKNLLAEPEEALLQSGLATLVRWVDFMRPTEMRDAACYAPMPLAMLPACQSADRLKARVPLVEKLVKTETLHADAARVVLASIDADIKTLQNSEMLLQMQKAEDRQEAVRLREAARVAADALRRRLLAPALASNRVWTQLPALVNQAEEVVAGRGPVPFNEAARQNLINSLSLESADVGALAAPGVMSQDEASVLQDQLMALAAEVGQRRTVEELRRPVDRVTLPAPVSLPPAGGPMCYIVAAPWFDTQPLSPTAYLSQRLPLLEKLAQDEVLHRDVILRILDAVEADIKVLGEKKAVQAPATAADQQETERVRQAATAAVEHLRERLKASP